MSVEVKLRRGTTAEHASFTGAAGEVTVDTTKNTLVVHDGSTAGGHPLAKEGSGGWQDVSQVVPTSPSSYNDEFDGSALDSNWIKVDVPGYAQVYTQKNGVLSVKCKDRGVVTSALLKPFTGLTPPVTIETAFRILNMDTQYPSAGLIFSEGVTYGSGGKVMVTGYQGFNADTLFTNLIAKVTDFITRNSFVERNMGALVSPFCYLRLVWVSANTFRLLISPDGITWLQPDADQIITCNPTYFGLCMTGSDNNGDDFAVTFEYFRVY